MTLSLDPKSVPFLCWPATQELIARLRDGGVPFRFVGGAVRDTLLGRTVDEVDLATPLAPEAILKAADAQGIRHKEPGLSHGTVILLVDHTPFEITTLRRDVKTDGRHAEVLFTEDWEEDSARRDFTINAIYMDADGVLSDPQGGIADAQEHRVRFIGDADQRLQEDRLRALRFLRFHAQLGHGELDPAGVAAVQRSIPFLDQLSGERLLNEWVRLLPGPQALQVLCVIEDLGLLTSVLPNLFGAAGWRDAFAWLQSHEPQPWQFIPRFLVTCGQPLAAAKRLRFSRHDTRAIERLPQWLVTWDQALKTLTPQQLPALLHAIDGEEKQESPKKIKEERKRQQKQATRWLPLLLRLHAAWNHNRQTPTDVAQTVQMITLAEQLPSPRLPIAGHDLLSLGLMQGAQLGQTLVQVKTWWRQQGCLPDRQDCLEKVEEIIANRKA